MIQKCKIKEVKQYLGLAVCLLLRQLYHEVGPPVLLVLGTSEPDEEC